MSSPLEIIIVTGLSGAGKSTALRVLEDMGFFCVDNLPTPLARECARLAESRSDITKIALGMRAIKDHFSIGEASCLALQAGAHMVMVAKDQGDQAEAYEAVLKATERGKIEREQLEASFRRISREKQHIRERFPSTPTDGKKIIGSKEHRKLIRDIKNLS